MKGKIGQPLTPVFLSEQKYRKEKRQKRAVVKGYPFISNKNEQKCCMSKDTR